MDMWPPSIKSTRRYVPDADSKIVAAHLGEAVDKVGRKEPGQLLERGDATLTGTEHLWLQKPENIDPDLWEGTFTLLKEMVLKTARAWAKKAWTKWLAWAGRSQLEPMKKVACMIRKHLQGIINAIVLGANNATSESINAKIQRVKRMACGFSNRDNFRIAMYFHLGGLALLLSRRVYPHETLKRQIRSRRMKHSEGAQRNSPKRDRWQFRL
jgi:transposase